MKPSLIAQFRAVTEPLPLTPADFDDPHFWDQIDEMLALRRAELTEALRLPDAAAREG